MNEAQEYLMMRSQIAALRKGLREITEAGINPFRMKRIATHALNISTKLEYEWRRKDRDESPL